MKAQKRNRSLSKVEVAIVCFIAVIAVFFIIGMLNTPQATNTSNGSDTVQTEPTKENTSDLDLTVKPYVMSLEITNNESKKLENCEVRINDGYKTRTDLASKKAVDINYNLFTKNAERFDADKYAVETIVVDQCKGQTARMGIYGK